MEVKHKRNIFSIVWVALAVVVIGGLFLSIFKLYEQAEKAQMEKQAEQRKQAAFRAEHTVSTHTSVGGSATAGGSYTAESGGNRMSLKEQAPDAPIRPKEAPDIPRKRPSLDD